MSVALLDHQLRSLMRRGRLIGLLLLALVPALILLVVGLAEGTAGPLVEEIVANVGATTFPIAALILAAATLRDERDAGTLPYLYLKPIGRLQLAWMSILAAAIATAALGAVAVVGLLGATAVVGADVGAAIAGLPLYLAAAVGYSALFVPLGYLIPRIVLIGLAYVILWEQVAARVFAGMANTSIWRFSLSIYADLVGDSDALLEALGPMTPGAWGGIAKVAVVVVLGVGLLTWALRRRDAL